MGYYDNYLYRYFTAQSRLPAMAIFHRDAPDPNLEHITISGMYLNNIVDQADRPERPIPRMITCTTGSN